MSKIPTGANQVLSATSLKICAQPLKPAMQGIAFLCTAHSTLSLNVDEPLPEWLDRTDEHWQLDLNKIPDQVEHLYIALYIGRAAGSLSDLALDTIELDEFTLSLSDADLNVSALCFAEIYRRNGAWKVRARSDGVFRGIEEMAQRFGTCARDQTPEVTAEASDKSWTGSGFLVQESLLLTNAHVVEKCVSVTAHTTQGQITTQALIIDQHNDLALIRLEEPLRSAPLYLREGVRLGESVTTVGYPLAGLLGSGPQVTRGEVSGVLGIENDASTFQISAPIQPGSSGGPVLDRSGAVIGITRSALRGGQQVNFAVRASLAAALINAAGAQPQWSKEQAARDLESIISEVRASVVLLHCLTE